MEVSKVRTDTGPNAQGVLLDVGRLFLLPARLLDSYCAASVSRLCTDGDEEYLCILCVEQTGASKLSQNDTKPDPGGIRAFLLSSGSPCRAEGLARDGGRIFCLGIQRGAAESDDMAKPRAWGLCAGLL